MTDGGKPGKPSAQHRKVAGTIIETPNNDYRNAKLVDELYSINNRKRVGNNPQVDLRGRGAVRRSGAPPVTRSTDAGVGSSRPSVPRQLSGKVKSLEQSSRYSPASGKALRLEYSGTRDASLPKSPVSGANKRQRLESLGYEDSGISGSSSAKARPQSLFATTAAAAGLRTAQVLRDIPKDAASDCDDTVLEVVSGNTSDGDFADGGRESLSKQHRTMPSGSAQTHSRCDEDLKAAKGGDVLKTAPLSSPSSIRDRLSMAKGDSEQIVASGRVQRSVAGFSSKPNSTAPPEIKNFFSIPTHVKGGDTQTGKSPDKLVNQLRPKTARTTNDDDDQSTGFGAGGKSNLESINKPPTVLPGRTIAGRSRVPLTRMYHQGFASSPASPMSQRRRTIAIGPTIDLRSPSPPLMPAKSPPLKPQGRRLSKSSPQKQQQQQQPQQRPPKSFPLRGVRIGHHVQIADVHAAHATKDPSSHLKITIRYMQRTMEISGLRESNELMKISAADILALEYTEQRNLAVMCIIPNDTMESLFEEVVFDPSCDDKSRRLIYLCWGTQAKGDRSTFARLQESFGGDIEFSALDVSDFQKYASELTKPASIDLISSDDDGGCGGDGCGSSSDMAKPAASTAKSDTNSSHSQSSSRDKAASIGASQGLSAVKSQYWSSINSATSTSFMSSIGERTRGKSKYADDDAYWESTNVYGKRALSSRAERRTSTPSFFATESRGYELRKTNVGSMAEPPSSLEEDNNSGSDGDDFVVQHRKVGIDVYSLKFEYPPDGGKSIYVGGSDISRLRSGEFLNDTIIEFYMRYISENLRTADAKLYERCFFFNTFFFKKLSQRSRAITTDDDEDPMGVVYNQLKKWTASVDLFDKDYIFVPINENIHWYLAVITNPRAMLSTNPEASATDPNGNDICAATPPKPADPPAASPTVDLPPLPSTLFPSPPSSRPSLDRDDSLAPALQNSDGDIDIEMADSSANEDMAGATEALSQANVTKPGLELSPSTLELEEALKQDMTLDRSESVSLSGDKPPPHHVIDLSLDAMPATGAADADVLKAKARYVDPETTSSIIILDSLGNRHQSTFGLLRGYMQAEANYRHRRADVAEAMVGKYAKVPLQTNLCDCGVFLLQYIENFVKDPATFMSSALNGADMRTWFDPGMMRKKRESMMRLAIRLANEYEQLQKSKADTQDSAKSEAQPAAREASKGSDRPSDPLPALAVVTDSELGGKEPSGADDAE